MEFSVKNHVSPWQGDGGEPVGCIARKVIE